MGSENRKCVQKHSECKYIFWKNREQNSTNFVNNMRGLGEGNCTA